MKNQDLLLNRFIDLKLIMIIKLQEVITMNNN